MLKISIVILLICLSASVSAFTCSQQGLFPDINSPDCTSYHICVLDGDGLVLVEAVCPPGLVFHWSLLGCVPSSMFNCPNMQTTTTAAPITTDPVTPPPGGFRCPYAGNFPDEESLDCRSFFTCSGVGAEPIRQTCPGQMTFNWEERRCMVNNNAQCPPTAPPFDCDGVGDSPDPDSEDCSHFFRCFVNWDGSVVHTRMSCPGNMAFDWILLTCRLRNLAECLATTPGPIITTTTTAFPTITTTTPAITPPPTTTTTTAAATTTTTATTTASSTTTTPPGGFWCPDAGNFPDEYSLDCRGFFHCSAPGAAPIRQTCPGQTTFNWEERRCMANNNAQCPPTAPPFDCDGVGDAPDPDSEDCSHFFRCFVNWDGSIVHTRMSCPGNLAFDWVMLICRNRNQAECLATTPPPDGFRCPAAGNFPDEESEDCRTFFTCAGPGLDPVRETCPGQSTFNWELRRCMDENNADCPVSTAPFDCQGFGDFPDISSPDCTHFFRCFENWDGSMIHTRMSCSENMAFDWEFNMCRPRSEVVCQGTTQAPPSTTTTTTSMPITTTTSQMVTTTTSHVVTTTTSHVVTTTTSHVVTTTTSHVVTTTTSHVVTTTSPADFICPGSGNFPDESSLDCRNFHSCSGAGQRPSRGNCNGNTIFNWAQRTCNSANQFECAMQADPFECPSTGDFPNPNSRDCSRYFQCFTMWSGELRHQTGICQGNTVFDWNRRQCISRNQAACLA